MIEIALVPRLSSLLILTKYSSLIGSNILANTFSCWRSCPSKFYILIQRTLVLYMAFQSSIQPSTTTKCFALFLSLESPSLYNLKSFFQDFSYGCT